VAASSAPPGLSDEQLPELLELMREADSVELKLTVPESAQYTAATALGLDPLDAQIRQVYFFDTPDLDLNRHGVVLRARRVQGKGGDSVVKLRPVVPRELPKTLRKSAGFTVEVDAMPGGYVCSGTLKQRVGNNEVRQVMAGARPLEALLSKTQRAFLSEHAPDGLTLDDLSVLGPILVLKLKFGPEGFERRLVAELWMYPDGSRVLELSTKCDPGEAFQAAAETRAFLAERGVDLHGKQEAKTVKALEFFADRLKPA
jgi:CYTH domain